MSIFASAPLPLVAARKNAALAADSPPKDHTAAGLRPKKFIKKKLDNIQISALNSYYIWVISGWYHNKWYRKGKLWHVLQWASQ